METQATALPPSPDRTQNAPALGLREDRHFTRFLFPFAFSEQQESGWWRSRFRALRPFLRKLNPWGDIPSEPFERVARRIERLTVADTSFANHVKEKFWERSCWQSLESSRPKYILPHVASFVLSHGNRGDGRANERSAPYVRSYQLDDLFRQALFPPQGKCVFVTKEDREWLRFGIDVEDVRLYLFRSGIGFLVFDVALQERVRRSPDFPLDEEAEGLFVEKMEGADAHDAPLDLEHLALFNRGFRHLKAGSGDACVYVEKGAEEKTVRVPSNNGTSEETRWLSTYGRLGIDDVIQRLLTATIGPEKDAAGSASGEASKSVAEERSTWEAFYHHRLLTYTFGLVDQQATGAESADLSYERVRGSLYRLRHSFDENYQPTEADLAAKETEEVLRTFENVAFGLSMEGGAVLAWDDDPEGTEFIQNQLHVKIRGPYFLLYLLALHQRLGSIQLAKLIGQANYHRQGLRNAPGVVKRRIRNLRERIFEFVVRSWFAEVSNMRMYTDVYRRWQDVLEVVPLLDEVKSEVSELDDYLQRIEADRQQWIFGVTSAFFFPVVLFSGIMSMQFDKLWDFSPQIWVVTLVVGVLYYAGLWAYMRLSR